MARETSRAEERLRQALLEEGARELASLAAVGPLISSMFNQLYSAVGQPRFAVLVTEDDEARSEDVFLLEQPQPQPAEQTIFLHASECHCWDCKLGNILLVNYLSVGGIFIVGSRIAGGIILVGPVNSDLLFL
jgi:hypothetical protein